MRWLSPRAGSHASRTDTAGDRGRAGIGAGEWGRGMRHGGTGAGHEARMRGTGHGVEDGMMEAGRSWLEEVLVHCRRVAWRACSYLICRVARSRANSRRCARMRFQSRTRSAAADVSWDCCGVQAGDWVSRRRPSLSNPPPGSAAVIAHVMRMIWAESARSHASSNLSADTPHMPLIGPLGIRHAFRGKHARR